MKRIVSVIAALSIVFLALTSFVSAAVPNRIYYQGQLTDALGAPLDTVINMTFTIYDDSSTGAAVWWSETQPGIVVSSGLFTVLLGSVNAIVDTVFRDNFRWLGVQIASDPEITPRTRLVTVPYAYRVSTLDGATGGHVFGWIQLHSDLVIGDLFIEGAPGGLHVTDGNDPFFQADGNTKQVGIGMIDPNGDFHVETTNRLFSGSFTSTFPSASARVVQSEHLGTGAYDATAVYGRSAPQDYYGFGGDFQGGFIGVRAQVFPTGGNVYVGSYAVASGGSGTNYGLNGVAVGSGSKYGAFGEAWGAGSNYGVYGRALDTSATTNYGVYGFAANATTNWAGYFQGDVTLTGEFVYGKGGSKIDHPLDPENKYLRHSSVESPEMKNVYDGVVTLDGRGEATVQLPEYFQALNGDFRYQLTAIGAPGPNLYVAEKISDNRFRIAGGEPGMEVSWQVTGIRKDAFAEANRIQVETNKPVDEQGKYLHPEAYGLGDEYGVNYEQHKRLREQREGAAAKMDRRSAADATD